MGTTFTAKIIIGIHANSVLTKKHKVTEVKKYNPDTGEPYLVKINEITHYLFDKPISSNSAGFLEGFLEESTNMSLDYISINDEYYIGKHFSSSGTSNDSLVNYESFSKLKTLYDEVSERLRYEGYTGEVFIINILEYS